MQVTRSRQLLVANVEDKVLNQVALRGGALEGVVGGGGGKGGG